MEGIQLPLKQLLFKQRLLRKPLKNITVFLVFTAIILTSCKDNNPVTPLPPSQSAEPSTIPAPTHSPTPIPKTTTMLLSDDSLPGLTSEILSVLREFSIQEGWDVLQVDHANFVDIPPGVRLLIALPPDPGLQELAIQFPDIQFLAIGIPDLQAQPNLSIIAPGGFPLERQAFIAGYISAILTKDWRIGLIVEADSDLFQVINQSFTNGIVYYCGLCRQAYPPFHNYPIPFQVAEDASDEEWLSAADLLLSYSVETIFVYAQDLKLPPMEYLISKGVTLIGVQAPSQELEHAWATTIRFTPEDLIREYWQDLTEGRGGWIADMPILFVNINDELFSIGRQHWAMETLTELVNGFIEPGESTQDNLP